MSTRSKRSKTKAPKKVASITAAKKVAIGIEPMEKIQGLFIRQGNPSMFVEAFAAFDSLKVGGPAMTLSPPAGTVLESFRSNFTAALRKHLGVDRLREHARIRATTDGRIAVQRIA